VAVSEEDGTAFFQLSADGFKLFDGVGLHTLSCQRGVHWGSLVKTKKLLKVDFFHCFSFSKIIFRYIITQGRKIINSLYEKNKITSICLS
jgi:hypothetical protein